MGHRGQAGSHCLTPPPPEAFLGERGSVVVGGGGKAYRERKRNSSARSPRAAQGPGEMGPLEPREGRGRGEIQLADPKQPISSHSGPDWTADKGA